MTPQEIIAMAKLARSLMEQVSVQTRLAKQNGEVTDQQLAELEVETQTTRDRYDEVLSEIRSQ